MTRSQCRGGGWARWCVVTSSTTPCQPTTRVWPRSASTSLHFGGGRFGVAARRTGRRGSESRDWRQPICRCRVSFIPGLASVLPSNTPGGSPVRESRPPGSVRGALSNERPYRDRFAIRWLYGLPIPQISVRFEIFAHVPPPMTRVSLHKHHEDP